MKLTLDCSVCSRKYDNLTSKLRVDPNLNESQRELAASLVKRPKPVSIVKEYVMGTNVLTTYSCGHTIVSEKTQTTLLSKYTSNTAGYKAYDYQIDGVDFVERSNYNCLIADEMGLGKTVQAILAWINNAERLSPCVFIVKAATVYQWIKMFREWGTLDQLGICPLSFSKTPVFPGFKCYILSMDLLPDLVDKLITLAPRLVVVDECQSFKNTKSSRSKALVKLCHTASVPHKIFLSGTPVMNRASEYFVILNLLAPGHFPDFRTFAVRWLEPVGKGSLNRIRPRLIEQFKTLTSRWIIRRQVADVQKDLPALRRVNENVEITDPVVKKMYNAKLDLFSNYMKDVSQKKDPIALLGWLAQLRHITAEAKMNECCEIVKDFLDSTEEQKITIGIHHKSVRDGLFYGLEPYGALKLSGEDDGQTKDQIITKFKQPERRVMIINIISGGTGLDGLQCCNNVIVLERQWNAALEEQFEKRFQRDGQTRPVLVTYLNAAGTIDEFFADLVEVKRKICGETMEGYDFQSDAASIMQLANTVIEHRL